MTKHFVRVLVSTAAFCFCAAANAQAPLPTLIATNFGTFALKAQTSITNNNPGVNSSYSVVGGGNELWGPKDTGFYAYFVTNGNFDVRIRVESLEPVHRYAKSGLMVRESLSSTARMISLFATPSGPTQLPADNPVGEDQVEFNFRRSATDSGANNINLGSPEYPNGWLRLARRGSIVYGLVSHDGSNWVQSASVDTSAWPGGALRPNVLLGIGSSSHDDSKLVHSELRDFSEATSTGALKILGQPANALGVIGSTADFSVSLNDPVDAQYQWFVNGTPIPAATNATYTTATLGAAQDNARYSVRVTGPGGTAASGEAALSVVSIEAPSSPNLALDFDDGEVPAGTLTFGTAEIDPSAGIGGSGGLVLTRASNNQNGALIIDDFNGGAPVDSFNLAFKLKIGPGSAKPADGFSVSFGTNIPNARLTAPQQGVGPGLAVSFDIYDNGNAEAPAIDIFYGVDPSVAPDNLTGNLLHYPLPLSELLTSRYVDVVLRMNSDGKLDLLYNGRVIAYQLQTPFTPVAGGKFAFGGYAGGQNAFQAVDEIRIATTTLGSDAYVSSILPLGNNVSAKPEIVVTIVDQSTQFDPNAFSLGLNDSPVTPSISNEAETSTTTLRYSVPSLLAAGSTNRITFAWSDSAGTRRTNNATFRVGGYTTLAADSARPLGSGNAADSGFNVRLYQVGTNIVASSQYAESILAGEQGENFADLTIANPDGVFVDPIATTTIDYDVNAAPLGLSTFPGIPGVSDSKENFAAEITAFIEFPQAGFYQMGVRSDDGFILTEGSESAPLTLGAFEGEREPADTIFGFVVPQPGVYPFRLVYYQATGGGAVRWFTVANNGEQTLINDPNRSTALKAYRTATGTPPQGSRVAISSNSSGLVVSWTGSGVLETRPALGSGTWTAVPGAKSPYPVAPGAAAAFFRVRE